MNCDVGEATEGLESELWRRWSDGKIGEWGELIFIVIAELILQPFCHFPYFTTHSPTLPSLYLRHSSFSNPSVASPTSQFILQPFFRFSYVTSSSLNSPGEPPMVQCIRNMSRKCLNDRNNFRYAFDELTLKAQRRNFTPLVRFAYDCYFNILTTQ